jgi:ribosome recycling factor
VRRDAIESIRKQEKAGDVSEDEARDLQDNVQKLTDKYVQKVEQLLVEKETDITTI